MSLKMGHVQSKTRSLPQILQKPCVCSGGKSFHQILEKPCVRAEGQIFGLIIIKLGQNVSLDEIWDKLENGSC